MTDALEGNSCIRAEHLQKKFGRKQVVYDVSFEVKQGEVVGLLGPNGAGKTTAFYMVVGFLKLTGGSLYLDSKNISKMSMYKRSHLGISYLPQESSIFRKLTVEQNIYSLLEPRKDITKKQKKEIMEELIEDFSLQRVRKQFGDTLSGGERRRTEIARSLTTNPKFLLLDEPFAGLDPIVVSDIKQMISILVKRNIGILITDHNIRDTLQITDRAYIINQGHILVHGSLDEILASDVARQIYLGEDFSM